MPFLYGAHFEYNGVSSRLYGLILANIDTSPFRKLGGETEDVTFYNPKEGRRYMLGVNKTDSPISTEIEIVSDNGAGINPSQRREIERWLFGAPIYRKLYFDDADDCNGQMTELVNGEPKRLYFNCRFTNPEIIEYAGGVYGYKATMEADSDMMWQDPVVYTFGNHVDALDGSGAQGEVIVDSDGGAFIYPKVTIKMIQPEVEPGTAWSLLTIMNVVTQSESSGSTRTTAIQAYATSEQRIIYTLYSYINKADVNNPNIKIRVYSGESGLALRMFPRLENGRNFVTVDEGCWEISYEFSNRRYL